MHTGTHNEERKTIFHEVFDSVFPEISFSILQSHFVIFWLLFFLVSLIKNYHKIINMSCLAASQIVRKK